MHWCVVWDAHVKTCYEFYLIRNCNHSTCFPASRAIIMHVWNLYFNILHFDKYILKLICYIYTSKVIKLSPIEYFPLYFKVDGETYAYLIIYVISAIPRIERVWSMKSKAYCDIYLYVCTALFCICLCVCTVLICFYLCVVPF